MSQLNTPILVTGGTGFLGSYLLRYLCHKGYSNIRATRRASSPMNLVESIADKVEWIEADMMDITALGEAMNGIQKVYHCAAFISHDPKDAEKMRVINVEGTANVVNTALHAQVQKFLHVSSIAAIGRKKNFDHISEQSKWERNPLNSAYAISKHQAEQEAWRGMAEGLNIIVINPSIIIGSGFWDLGTCEFFKKSWKGLRFYPIGGSGFVDVRDVARMCLQLMEGEFLNKRYIANSENISYQKFFTLLAQQLGKSAPSIKVPPLLAQTVATLLNIPAKITGWRSPLTPETALMTSNTFYYENQKSIDELNFKYTPMQQSIAETCTQFKEAMSNNQNASYLPLID